MQINVLWIDDQPNEAFIDKADREGIYIEVCQNVDSGITELLSPSKSYDAIIIDANCIYHKADTTIPDISALSYALLKITENNINLPWFVYSGGGFEGENSIDITVKAHERTYDDKLWYRKPKEMNLLFDAIKRVVSSSDVYKMKARYPAICEMYSENDLISLLHDFENNENFQYDITIPNRVRDILDWVMSYLNKMGVIPFVPNSTELNKCSQFVGKNNKVVPTFVQRAIHSCVFYANPGSHRFTEIKEMIKSGKAPYLNKMALYELLTILYWCSSLEKDDNSIKRRYQDSLFAFEYHGCVTQDGMGKFHCGDFFISNDIGSLMLGNNIGIIQSEQNRDVYTKSMYKKKATKMVKL